jgi:hypothetical protein
MRARQRHFPFPVPNFHTEFLTFRDEHGIGGGREYFGEAMRSSAALTCFTKVPQVAIALPALCSWTSSPA